jgi:hypothetical protein
MVAVIKDTSSQLLASVGLLLVMIIFAGFPAELNSSWATILPLFLPMALMVPSSKVTFHSLGESFSGI